MYKIVYDAETQQEIQENLSTEDLNFIETAEQISAEFKQSIFVEENQNKISAIEKLKDLGLTEEEAKAIVGI